MTAAAADIGAERRETETLLIVGTASVLSALDLFVVNVAFPSLRASFPGTTNQTLSWVLSAYSILFAAVLVPAGRLADRYGRKRVFRLGIAVFGLASAACALAPTVAALVVARALKGVGAAMMVPTSLGLLLAAHPRERHTQMVAIWAATGSIAAALGPVLGGALVELSWRLIFLINVPLAAWATWRSAWLRDTAPREGTALPDLVGSSALVAGLAALVAGISYGPEWGLDSARLLGTLGAAFALLLWFLWRCVRHPSPALELRMFRSAPFFAATLGMGVFYIGFAMMLLGATLYLGSVWRWTALAAGGGIGGGPMMAVVSALVAGRRNVAPRRLVLLGASAFIFASLWWWWRLDARAVWLTEFVPGLLVFGIGAGVAQTGFLSGGTAALPPADYATGSAVLNTARQLGAAVGVALFVALSKTASAPADFAPVWLAIATCSLVAASFLLIGRRRRSGS